MQTLLMFGDSHSHAVHLAVEKRRAKGLSSPLAVYRIRKEKGRTWVGNTSFEAFLVRIAELSSSDVVLSAVGGNDYAKFSTVQHPEPFDFHTPHAAAVMERAQTIPLRALSHAFADSIEQSTGAKLRALREATKARLVHLILPPPKADTDFIRLNLEKAFADQDASRCGISPPELRLKAWQLQRTILHKVCHKLGIEVMQPPPKSVESGFLKPKYYGADSTHANRHYGELVLRAVESKFLSAERSLRAPCLPNDISRLRRGISHHSRQLPRYGGAGQPGGLGRPI